MRRLAAALVIVSALPVPIAAQERDRSTERMRLALQNPTPLASSAALPEAHRDPTRQTLGISIAEPLPATFKLGPFTMVRPQLRGELIRLSLPIGEYVSRGARALAAANRRRQEAAARRMVEADLKAFAGRQPPR